VRVDHTTLIYTSNQHEVIASLAQNLVHNVQFHTKAFQLYSHGTKPCLRRANSYKASTLPPRVVATLETKIAKKPLGKNYVSRWRCTLEIDKKDLGPFQHKSREDGAVASFAAAEELEDGAAEDLEEGG
jgi:hypothetical protein